MSEKITFYKEGELDTLTIAPAYQEAFSDWPWYEVSKCADPKLVQRCAGGLSRIALGETCTTCKQSPTQPAYEPTELVERFQMLEATRPTRWYVESIKDSPALVALAWTALPETIAQEKYPDVPPMQNWLVETLGSKPVIWLDEVFADKTIRPKGNLINFRRMCEGFMTAFDTTQLAYRTISPAMIRTAENNFNTTPVENVPDRRAFITIRGESL